MYVHVLTDASIHVYMHAYTNREGAPGTTSQVLRIKREETRSFGKVGLFSRTSCRAHTPGCACVWYVYVYVYEYEYVYVYVNMHVYVSVYVYVYVHVHVHVYVYVCVHSVYVQCLLERISLFVYLLVGVTLG